MANWRNLLKQFISSMMGLGSRRVILTHLESECCRFGDRKTNRYFSKCSKPIYKTQEGPQTFKSCLVLKRMCKRKLHMKNFSSAFNLIFFTCVDFSTEQQWVLDNSFSFLMSEINIFVNKCNGVHYAWCTVHWYKK